MEFFFFLKDYLVLAEKDFDKVIEVKKDFKHGFNNKGYCLLIKGDFEKSLEYFDQGLKLDNKFQLCLNNKGLALMNLKDY